LKEVKHAPVLRVNFLASTRHSIMDSSSAMAALQSVLQNPVLLCFDRIILTANGFVDGIEMDVIHPEITCNPLVNAVIIKGYISINRIKFFVIVVFTPLRVHPRFTIQNFLITRICEGRKFDPFLSTEWDSKIEKITIIGINVDDSSAICKEKSTSNVIQELKAHIKDEFVNERLSF
jgi:hypothetical protein